MSESLKFCFAFLRGCPSSFGTFLAPICAQTSPKHTGHIEECGINPEKSGKVEELGSGNSAALEAFYDWHFDVGNGAGVSLRQFGTHGWRLVV